jgi:hypothetical protein
MSDLLYINILDRSSKGCYLGTAGARRRSSQEGSTALPSERTKAWRGQHDGNRMKKDQAGHNVGMFSFGFCIQPVSCLNAIWARNNRLKAARDFDASSGN